MRLRPLGNTGLHVSECSVGTWGLSGDGYGAVSEDDARAALRCARELGINLFETADAYGAGAMEACLGQLFGDDPAAIFVTKIGIDRRTEPPKRRFDASYVEQAILLSCKRLRRSTLDVVLLHHPSEEYLLTHEVTATMRALCNRGLCKHWGVAAGNAAVAKLAVAQGAEVIEIAYNLLHPIDLHRIAGDALVGRVGILARSPLAYGLLSGSVAADKPFVEGDHRQNRWTPNELKERVELAKSLEFLVHGSVPSLRSAALRFVLASHVVSSAVLGPRSADQLKDLLRETGAGPYYLSEQDIREAFKVVERRGIEL